MRPTFLPLLLGLLLFPLVASAGDAPETTKPADIANMKTIGAALNAYKKAKGEFPDHLSDLVPAFLPDRKILLSPADPALNPAAEKHDYDPKLPCSYEYEFSTDPYRDLKITTREASAIQLQDLGPTVPILRCLLYDKAINLSHAGDIFETRADWESDPETPRLLKKNGPGPGLPGKKVILSLVDDTGQPIPGAVLYIGNRECSGFTLSDREFTADSQGKITVSLGTDEEPGFLYCSLAKEWFIERQHFTFGEDKKATVVDVATKTVVLIPTTTIGGLVHDPRGRPLAQATVEVFLHDHDMGSGLYKTKTDERGTWSLPHLPRSGVTLDLMVHHPDLRTYHALLGAPPFPSLKDFLAGEALIQLLPPFPITGSILHEGQPVPNARVYLYTYPHTHHTSTNAVGEFEFLSTGVGLSYLCVTADGLAPNHQDLQLTTDSKPITIQMDPGHPIKGRLVQGLRVGLPHAPILFQGLVTANAYSEFPDPSVIATTDATGRFTWAHAPRGTIVCTALLADGTPFQFEWDTTQNDEKIITVTP